MSDRHKPPLPPVRHAWLDASGDDLTIELPVRFVTELSAAASLNEVLQTVARWSRCVFGADRASITLAESDTHLRLICIEGNNAIPIDTPLPIEGTMVGRVYRQCFAEYMPDLTVGADLDCLMLSQHGLGCCLDTPLISGGDCFGTLNVANERVDAFGEVDLRRLEAMSRWVAASIRAHHRMEEMAVLLETDPLTGVCNRRAFADRFAAIAQHGPGLSGSLGVALIDLDYFKSINDTYGHEAGDRVLVHVTQALTGSCRKTDLVARLGGEEFVVVMSDVDKDGMLAILHRFAEMLAGIVVPGNDQAITVTASIGALLIEEGPRDPEFLIGQADQAMYRAKDAGRNRIEFAQLP